MHDHHETFASKCDAVHVHISANQIANNKPMYKQDTEIINPQFGQILPVAPKQEGRGRGATVQLSPPPCRPFTVIHNI